MDASTTHFEEITITPEMGLFARWKAGLVYAARCCRFSIDLRPLKYVIMVPIDLLYGLLVLLSFGFVWAAFPSMMPRFHNWIEILPISIIYRRFFYILLMPFWALVCALVTPVFILTCCMCSNNFDHWSSFSKSIWPAALDHKLTWNDPRKFVVQSATPATN